MEKIDGHIIHDELLKEGDFILDAGCRGFSLKKALGGKYRHICLDPDKSIVPPAGVFFENQALMNYTGIANYCGWSTGEGNHTYTDNPPAHASETYQVGAITIDKLMEKYGVTQFGLAKLDIEGGEYDLLLSIDKPFARQICAEFHQCCGHNKYGTHQEYMDKLMASPFGTIYKIADFYEYEKIKDMFEYSFCLI